ncbi:hypothetical protein C8J56DRAFT_881129 [Mycena floridula]|nr:hypothetical protein C8J56DRAFT_881129 [Mycena floridula]
MSRLVRSISRNSPFTGRGPRLATMVLCLVRGCDEWFKGRRNHDATKQKALRYFFLSLPWIFAEIPMPLPFPETNSSLTSTSAGTMLESHISQLDAMGIAREDTDCLVKPATMIPTSLNFIVSRAQFILQPTFSCSGHRKQAYPESDGSRALQPSSYMSCLPPLKPRANHEHCCHKVSVLSYHDQALAKLSRFSQTLDWTLFASLLQQLKFDMHQAGRGVFSDVGCGFRTGWKPWVADVYHLRSELFIPPARSSYVTVSDGGCQSWALVIKRT